MADVKKCDRCGVIYSQQEANFGKSEFMSIFVKTTLSTTTVINDKDLCPECEASLIVWFRTDENGGRRKNGRGHKT